MVQTLLQAKWLSNCKGQFCRSDTLSSKELLCCKFNDLNLTNPNNMSNQTILSEDKKYSNENHLTAGTKSTWSVKWLTDNDVLTKASISHQNAKVTELRQITCLDSMGVT